MRLVTVPVRLDPDAPDVCEARINPEHIVFLAPAPAPETGSLVCLLTGVMACELPVEDVEAKLL